MFKYTETRNDETIYHQAERGEWHAATHQFVPNKWGNTVKLTQIDETNEASYGHTFYVPIRLLLDAILNETLPQTHATEDKCTSTYFISTDPLERPNTILDQPTTCPNDSGNTPPDTVPKSSPSTSDAAASSGSPPYGKARGPKKSRERKPSTPRKKIARSATRTNKSSGNQTPQ